MHRQYEIVALTVAPTYVQLEIVAIKPNAVHISSDIYRQFFPNPFQELLAIFSWRQVEDHSVWPRLLLTHSTMTGWPLIDEKKYCRATLKVMVDEAELPFS